MTYCLALPPELAKLHNVFHMSMLRRYRSDESHILPVQDVQVQADFVRPEKFQFLEKWQNRNFDYKIVLSVKKIWNLFSRSRMKKRIAPLESSREI